MITGLADTLSERRDSLTEEQIDDCLARISRQGERLARLVADLLDLSQVESGTFRVSPNRSAWRRRGAGARRCPAPPDKSVELDVPETLWVLADPGRLEQILVNLLTNAYRYGGSPSAWRRGALRRESWSRSPTTATAFPISWCRRCSSGSPGDPAPTAFKAPVSGSLSPRPCWTDSGGASGTKPVSRAAPGFGSSCARPKQQAEARSPAVVAGPGAQGAPSEDSCEPLQLVQQLEALLVDLELVDALGVVAVAHLEDAERAPRLGLHLDVPQQEHVVEQEREPSDGLGLGAQCGRLACHEHGRTGARMKPISERA